MKVLVSKGDRDRGGERVSTEPGRPKVKVLEGLLARLGEDEGFMPSYQVPELPESSWSQGKGFALLRPPSLHEMPFSLWHPMYIISRSR